MKKRIIILLLFASFSIIQAQEVGIRFGDISGGNVALDAVFSTSKFTRVHGDLSFGKGIGLDLLVDFVNEPFGLEAFDWYAGLGPYIFMGNPSQLGIIGEFGLEYRFQGSPIVIGGDWRPYFRLIDNTNLGLRNFGFNIRVVL